jgi:hypothetical protein
MFSGDPDRRVPRTPPRGKEARFARVELTGTRTAGSPEPLRAVRKLASLAWS